ncbi:MAG: hypothetical protein AAB487_01870 [Patescibacteria group bacterium]
MYSKNFSGNQKSNAGDQTNQTNQTNQADKASQKNVLQREIIMQEADYRKSVNEKVKLEFEIRKIKEEEAQLRISLQGKELGLAKMQQDMKIAEEAIHKTKKKLNLI